MSRFRRALDHRVRHTVVAQVRRSRQVLLVSAATGVLAGLAVAGFEWVTATVLLEGVRRLPAGAQVVAPALGLLVAAGILHLGRASSAATADEYVRAFHDRTGSFRFRDVPAKLLAAVATLGSGGPLGYEGPSMYTGAAIGSGIEHRLRRHLSDEDAKTMLVAGAAAAVAAIFKAPVTGIVFALEVPYKEDLARHMLLPAAISAAAGYVTFAALAGTEPILPVAGEPPFDLRDLGGAALVGLACGLLARVFVILAKFGKDLADRGHPMVRALAAGAVLVVAISAGHAIDDVALITGPGYDALRWALEPDRAVLAIVAVGTLRVVATVAVLGGGGVGGLFIPLVIQGALVGGAIGGVLDPESTTLFPVVGMAAFLGAGYRVPLAAVVFVAEFTGRPGFVVPGLVAAVVAQLAIGRGSVSSEQVDSRIGPVERRVGPEEL